MKNVIGLTLDVIRDVKDIGGGNTTTTNTIRSARIGGSDVYVEADVKIGDTICILTAIYTSADSGCIHTGHMDAIAAYHIKGPTNDLMEQLAYLVFANRHMTQIRIPLQGNETIIYYPPFRHPDSLKRIGLEYVEIK